jgi:hypothetical protein
MNVRQLTPSLAAVLLAVSVTACTSSKAPDPSPSMARLVPKAAPTAGPMRDDRLHAYVDALRDELSRGKVGIVTDVMNLNAEESKKFWPLYQEYETELFELGDTRVAWIRRYAMAQQAGKLDDREAAELAKAYFDFEGKRVELLRKYHGLVAEELSPVRAAQFTQLEHRVGLVIDLMLACELPLIELKTAGPTPYRPGSNDGRSGQVRRDVDR